MGDNTKTILAERGLNLDWVAAEIGIDVQTILKAFSDRVEMWLLFDISGALEVAPDALLGTHRIASVEALCSLPEGIVISDSSGAVFTKDSSGRETTNPNWIAWVADATKHRFHSDEIFLPVTVIGASDA